MSVSQPHRRKYTRKRATPQENWVNEPLQNDIRDALARKDWSISDLARAIGSQPSLVSRWMMGARPNTESIQLVAQALGLDAMRLMVRAGHIPSDPDAEAEDPVLSSLLAKLRTVPLTKERAAILNGVMETMLKIPVN